jgi:Flp pilus assembly protein TadG
MTVPRAGRWRGQSIVELAVALPMLVWLFCGILDLGRAYYYGVTATDASRDAVRMLVTNAAGFGPGVAAGCAAVQAAVTNLDTSPTCPSSGTTAAGGRVRVVISCWDAGGLCVGNPLGSTHNQAVTVDVYYGFQLFTPLISSMVPGGVITLHGRSVMASTW